LTEGNHTQFWVLPGFSDGSAVLSDSADFLSKTTDDYAVQREICIAWNDPPIGTDLPLAQTRFTTPTPCERTAKS
jgi:dTDP-4-dehydrorhamnose 3,5-epimerase